MKKPISNKQNYFNNGTNIDASDLQLEQNYNNSTQTAMIDNHFGSGVLSDNLIQNILFDTDKINGLLDGKALDCQLQPADNNYGNLLEIELTESNVASKRTIKVFIIGLDFNGNLQYDKIIFHKNEKQVNSKHYTKVLKVFINDLFGDPNQSMNLGGRLTIKESKSLYLSRNCKSIAQDVEPDVFLRDFFVAGTGTLATALAVALPSYNIDNLNLTLGYKNLRGLVENDVSSQVGQKFQAVTNNIQKITLLMSVINNTTPSDLAWTGNLIVNLYQLQSSVNCPSDITPDLAIDFDPFNIPLAQISLSYNDLLDRGIQLNETPQPVDFVFSNTQVGSGSLIKPNGYYAITAKRGGAADKCEIQFASGSNRLDNSVLTLFNGSIWVDVQEEDLWFQVWTDAAQVADGQAYDEGQGVVVEKVQTNSTTGAVEDYAYKNIQFNKNDVYYAILEAATQKSTLVQDQRTGESVYSQQQLVPNISLLSPTQVIERQQAADPFLIGTIADKNLKTIATNSTTVSGKFHSFGMIKNQLVIKVIDDTSDPRYDSDIINLVNEISGSGGISNINGLLNGQIITDINNPQTYYRIADTELISMIYGDLNGDGVVDENDLSLLNDLIDGLTPTPISIDINSVPSYQGYLTETNNFKSDTGMSWRLLNSYQSVLASGNDGIFTVDPNNQNIANFSTASTLPSAPYGFVQIYNNTTNPSNNGTFRITSSTDSHNVLISKKYLDSNVILELFRADINGDMVVDINDYNYINNYVSKSSPFPNTTAPANKIGTVFNAIRFTLEPFVDRADDYTSSVNRSSNIHVVSDVLIDGYNAGFSNFGVNLSANPIVFNINKKLNWFDYLVNSTSNPKLISAVYSSTSANAPVNCQADGIDIAKYPVNPAFDPGRNDQFVSNNIIINDGGQIIRPDGYYYSVDFETSSILLEIPAVNFQDEKNINVFTDFVANYNNGKTRLGYNALRYADCSFVNLNDLNEGRVKFSVCLNSFSPEINGTDLTDPTITGIIVDGGIGVSFNELNGILTLNFNNLYEDPVLETQKTRILITVFLKKAGFKNSPLKISSYQLKNLLQL